MGSLIRRFFELTMNALSILLLAVAVSSAPLDDAEDVAAAKAAFKAAFDDAAAGGLAAKQEPAPIHVVSAPATAHAEPDASVEAIPVADPVVHALPFIAYHPFVYHVPFHYPVHYTYPLLTVANLEEAEE